MGVTLPYRRKVKDIEYSLYRNEEDFRKDHPDTSVNTDWRNAEEGEWILTDDGQVTMVIKRGMISDESNIYIRTLIGMVNCKRSNALKGEPITDIWRFSRKNWYESSLYGNLSNSKRIFAKYVASGLEPVDAYMKAYSRTKDREYAKKRTTLFLKSKKVRHLIDKEIELLLSDTGITKSYLLEKTKDIVDDRNSRDSDKMRAIEVLMKISGLLSTEKRTDSIALIQEFTGFSKEKLNAFKAGVLPEPSDMTANGEKT